MNKADAALLAARKAGYTRLNRAQYFVVTFDLSGAAGREALYPRFKKRLEDLLFPQNVVRTIKQIYFVKSIYSPADIRSEMQLLLEPQDSIIIVRLQPGHSYRLPTPGAGRKAKTFFDQLGQDEAET